MQRSLVIIGCGAWGSALSFAFARNFNSITLICHTNAQQQEFSNNGHPTLGIQYPKNTVLTLDYTTIKDASAVLIATPSYAFKEILANIQPFITTQPIAWATKGFSGNELLHQTFASAFPTLAPCVISGPSFAQEVAQQKPTALVVASPDSATQTFWTQAIRSDFIRTYSSSDIIGVEVGGAVKNILAIAAGIANGLGLSTNTLSALITRGLAEISRFGVALGADKQTFMGLSGLGDLTLTCLDDKSRNRTFGRELAITGNIEQAITNVGATVEGLCALEVVMNISKQQNIDMPISQTVNDIIQGAIQPKDAITILMSRSEKYE